MGPFKLRLEVKTVFLMTVLMSGVTLNGERLVGLVTIPPLNERSKSIGDIPPGEVDRSLIRSGSTGCSEATGLV